MRRRKLGMVRRRLWMAGRRLSMVRRTPDGGATGLAAIAFGLASIVRLLISFVSDFENRRRSPKRRASDAISRLRAACPGGFMANADIRSQSRRRRARDDRVSPTRSRALLFLTRARLTRARTRAKFSRPMFGRPRAMLGRPRRMVFCLDARSRVLNGRARAAQERARVGRD